MRQKKAKKKRRRLYSQILTSIIILVSGTIILCWILNTSLLGFVYVQHKRVSIRETYENLCQASSDGSLYKKSYRVSFEQMCANNNLSILVASPDGTIVLSSAGENSSAVMYVNLLDSMLRMRSSERVLLEESNRYTIERQTDSRMNGDYIVLWGSLEDGNT
ncbi:MAG: hypothetical protein VZR29_07395, partial [Lachnospiraceae bacterium]|nr:hypothetical protein [Lachnospiraceae bacterium]